MALAGCGGSSEAGPTTAGSASTAAAPPSPPEALSQRLVAAEHGARRAIAGWRRGGGAGGPIPSPLRSEALHVRAIVHRLAVHPTLAEKTIGRLSAPQAGETRAFTSALRDLHRLSAGWPAHRVETGPPSPIAELVSSYHAAQARFGVDWRYLASINLVESAFGRVRSHSVAGAQGPMQFMPASWHAYGLGGNIHDPGDAILAAANLLRRSGAPGDYSRALYAYNPSRLYVDAVRSYASAIGHDPDALYLLYSWPSP